MIRILLVFGSFLLAAQPPSSAKYELITLRQQAQAARDARDHTGYLRAALKVRTLLNDNPNAIESVARAYTESGELGRALDSLTEFAHMGQVDQSLLDGTNKTFVPLLASSRFPAILAMIRRNETPVSNAKTAFTLSDPALVPEDIDYDPLSKTFLITSVLEKKIIRVNDAGLSTSFASSPSHWPLLSIKVDAAKRLVWATEVALDGFTAAPKADWGSSALLCFDLVTGKLLRRMEGPHGSALGDMVLAPDGDPILSDGAKGGIYRVQDGTIKLLNGTDFISPQTPAVLPDGRHVIVPDYLRGLGVLNLASGRVQWLRTLASAPVALHGVDGAYCRGGLLFLTQNGASPETVVQVKIDFRLMQVVSSKIIERATPTLGDPTHGVLVNGVFYYIANSGWSELDDHGDLKPGSKMTTARIMRFVPR